MLDSYRIIERINDEVCALVAKGVFAMDADVVLKYMQELMSAIYQDVLSAIKRTEEIWRDK